MVPPQCRGTGRSSPPAPLHYVERGEGVGTGRFSVGGRGRGAGGVVMGEARGRGGARPRVGRYLDGRMHLVGGVWPPARQREEMAALTPGPSPPCGEGWIPAFAGLCVPGSVGKRGAGECGVSAGVLGRSGCGDWQGRGARPPGTTGAGRPARVRWRWVRHSDGADPAPRPQWPRGTVSTRCLQGGTQTVLTRRPGHDGQGYVSTRCPRSGTQAAMPRRARCGAGSVMTRCPRLGGGATAVH